MRSSHTRQLSFDYRYAPDDVQEVLVEEAWTGPPPLPPKTESSWPRSNDRNRTFLSTFTLPAAAWRPSPASSRSNEPRQPHYQTVSSSLLSQRRATVDSSVPPTEFAIPLPELPRRYSENATTLSDFPRPSSRVGGVKRKPVPALAIEDDLETVEDPLWDGKASFSREASSPTKEEFEFEERVRSLSLEELFPGGEMGLGFLVKEVDPAVKQPFGRMGRTYSSQSTSKSTVSCESDSGSADTYSLPPISTLSYGSNPSSVPSSTRASSPHHVEIPNEKPKARRPFALIRRRQSRPLEAHGSIIPSLATKSAPTKKQEEDLMEAWMEIMVGEEEEESIEEKRPALVFQSRPRKIASSSNRSRTVDTVDSKPRPESIASIANVLPPLRYTSASNRSSVVSLPPLDLSEAWRSAGFEVKEDSEDGSEEFHDAKSWTSDQITPPFRTLEPVPESPTPNIVPPPRSSSIRFSPLLDQTQFAQQQARLTVPPPAPTPSTDVHLRSTNPPTASAPKKRHSRSFSLDFLSNSTYKTAPPRPPKSARRLSRPEIIV
ncbi:hypothetical protein JCM5350_007604 [Sporobolomyces pararoseus]